MLSTPLSAKKRQKLQSSKIIRKEIRETIHADKRVKNKKVNVQKARRI